MRWLSGISARLLIVTVVVVMIVEIVIFVPSIALFRKNWIDERLVRAEIAAVTVMTAPGGRALDETERALLDGAGALNIVVAKDDQRFLALSGGEVPMPVETFDLREASALDLIVDAIGCMISIRPGDVHRVIGRTPSATYDRVEITLYAGDLRQAMIDYGLRILQLSLIISAITAGVVFIVVRRFVVAPLLDVVRGVEHFHADPTDPGRVIRPAGHQGEVADAERAIAAMQSEVLRALSERRRLASLGEAVAKINHDLRNMLAAGQLMTERLGRSEDPIVARVLPKLVASLDRAANLCNRTLQFGKAEERPPELRAVAVEKLLADVVEGLGLAADSAVAPGPTLGGNAQEDGTTTPVEDSAQDAPPALVLSEQPVHIVSHLGPALTVSADPDQLYRIFSNLMRNAAEAIRAAGGPGSIEIRAADPGEVVAFSNDADACRDTRHGDGKGQAAGADAPRRWAGTSATAGSICLLICDTGPGLPNKALENLFRPFIGGARRGGTGLGLAIAAELAAMQHGRLALISTSTAGTVFGLTLPLAPHAGRRDAPANLSVETGMRDAS
ncbi:MAG: HAMP domain-containing sensor histidine kinase [Pseudomonadota bacterium]